MTPEERARYQVLLERHVIAAWFPRSIDYEHGGYLCDFDRRWRACGPHDKLLEFQARQALTAAELLIAFPERPELREAAELGLVCLRDIMWDREYGGWYALTDRAGRPLAGGAKHAHGMAYAVQACVALHRATGDVSASALAEQSFAWLDARAHDPEHGGYFGPLDRGGQLLMHGSGARVDMIGTPFGWKDMNVNSDLYEALTYAVAYLPSSSRAMRERLVEMRGIVAGTYARFVEHPWHFYTAEWTPQPLQWRAATAVQTAARLLEDKLASDPTDQQAAARSLFEHAWAHGWSERLGVLRFICVPDRPDQGDATHNLQWWPQLELLRAAEAFLALDDEDLLAAKVSAAAGQAFEHHFLDARYGGSINQMTASLDWRARLSQNNAWQVATRKSDRWKDANHDGRTLLGLVARSEPSSKS